MDIKPIRQPLVLIFALALTGLLFLLDFVVPGSNFWGRFLLPILIVFLWGRRRDALTYLDQMMRRLGDTLAVESVPGQGSRFIITLPIELPYGS
jgi:hypothetical protein